MSDRNKAIVRRLVEDVLNGGNLDIIDELYAPEVAAAAKAWIAPFRVSFPDTHMEIVALFAEGDTVIGYFTCSGTQLADWLGHAPTGRRFEQIDEIGIYRLRDGRIVESWGIEDNLRRLQQLGLVAERDGRAVIGTAEMEEASLPVACSLSDEELAQRSEVLGQELFAFAEHVTELPDGFRWRFPGDGEWHARLLEFVAAERWCCSFLRIELSFAPGLGPAELTLRGPERTKAFISRTFGA